MKVGFDGGIRLEFHGAKVIPLSGNSGLLAYRDLDDALGLFDSVYANFHDNRTGRNSRRTRGLSKVRNATVYAIFRDFADLAHPLQYGVIAQASAIPAIGGKC